jgi:hypothetical protein
MTDHWRTEQHAAEQPAEEQPVAEPQATQHQPTDSAVTTDNGVTPAAPTEPDTAQAQPAPEPPSAESEPAASAPAQAEQTEAEQTQAEQTPAEHTQVEPAQAEPAQAEQTEAELAQAEQTEAESAQAEPAQAGPPQAEQAHPEPAQAEPAQAEPTQAEPTQTAPTHPEPTQAEPAQTAPAQTAQVHAEPTQAEPTQAEPAHAEPVRALPSRAPSVRPALADPSRWGRVDPDGTVYVRTADGERAVGSWKAGEPTEGLAHYARRFDDLLTEVELIEARLATGAGDPKHAMASVKQLREGLADAAVVGDLAGLAAKLDYLQLRAEHALGEAKAAREQARTEAVARKTALVEEAERIAAEATQWKPAGDRLRAILDEWKTIRGVDRKTDDALWKRFGKARDAFNRRRGSHFAELDRQRGAARARKEEIVAEAEQLVESTEWGPTAGRYKQLMVDWKAAGRAPKDVDDALWQRFRAAQDQFFARRSAAFSERDSELTANARKKEDLLAEAERIDPGAGLEAARATLLRIQERWEAVGRVPRERVRELEGRLRAVEEKVRAAVDAQWRRSDPEAQARVEQFRERVEQFEAQAAKARAAGDQRRAKQAEAQAAQWREWLAAAEQSVANR